MPIRSEIRKKSEEFVSKISKTLCIDSTRRDFASETFNTLTFLTKGLFVNYTGHQRLLLGRKGVGKTSFLVEMQKVANDFFGDDLKTIYYEYSMKKYTNPSILISHELHLEKNENIKSCEKILKEKKKFIFMVLDEIQILYLNNKNGQSVIDELFEIGCSRSGHIFCIITGSSYHLRQLCFAKLPDNLKKDYPNYLGLDLNSTKFVSRWIYPFLQNDDFKNLLKFVYKILEINNDEDIEEYNMNLAYLKSGGNPRILQEIVRGQIVQVDSYSISMRHFLCDSNKKKKILEVVFQCTSAYIDSAYISTIEDLPSNIKAFETWTKLFSYQVFLEKINQAEISQSELLPLIYDLADRGHLRFIENHVSSEIIGLGSPLIYLQLANNGNYTITLDEAFALKIPRGPYADIAENVILKILAENSHVLQIPGIQILDTSVEKLVLKKEYTNGIQDEINPSQNSDFIANRLFKECFADKSNPMQKNVFGVDGILLEIDQSKQDAFIAHRIQIKLGSHKSDIIKQTAEDIINKVNRNIANFKECFEATNKSISRCDNYIITTRGIESDAKVEFEKSGWKIIGRNELNKIWPESIKALGPPFK